MIVGDACGALVRDAVAGRRPYEIVERNDGYIGVGRVDYLLVSPDEMAELAEAAGWSRPILVQDDGPVYVGLLERL